MIRSLRPTPLRIATLAWLATAAFVTFSHTPSHAQRLSRSYLKNGAGVKQAFRDVVADASRATVQVYADGRHVALGTVVDSEGYVLTKASELEGGLLCRFRDGRRLEAQIVGVAHDYDLAMLKVDATGLPVIHWSASKELEVGRWLATPGVGDVPVAVGIVSVASREIEAPRGVLGISIESLEDQGGAKITEVFENSGAEEAGLKIGDVITRVSGVSVKDGNALALTIGSFRPGDMLELLITRGEEQLEIRARLGSQFSDLLDRGDLQNQMGGRLSARRRGFPAAIQHDTVLQPEECGGPVVNLDGEAVGVNIARAGRVESYSLPAHVILPLLEDLKSGKLAPFFARQSAPDPREVAGGNSGSE
ncbi:MAG: S1C family serine protease [Planctomycetaceae bacterium]